MKNHWDKLSQFTDLHVMDMDNYNGSSNHELCNHFDGDNDWAQVIIPKERHEAGMDKQ